MTSLRLYNGTNFIDQTGLAVFKLVNDTWEIVYDDPNFIPFAQDTRIYWVDGKITLSYNDDSQSGFPIRYSTLDIKDALLLSKPCNLIQNSCKLDKNATLICPNLIQYDFSNGKFITIKDKILQENDLFHFERLTKLYKSKIFFSVSTPAIPYGDKYLAVGHAKINYHHSYEFDSDLNDFIKLCKPQYHDKYIYMMFLYEFSKDCNIERLSFSFIPIDPNKNESYLSFASGIFEYKNNIYVTFGEDDVKTKIISFEHDEIETLLNDNQKFSNNFKPGFLIKNTVDFNEYLVNSKLKNCFTFNNSMIHWKDNLFIMVYRLVYLYSDKEYNNPLEIWYHVWDQEWKLKKYIS